MHWRAVHSEDPDRTLLGLELIIETTEARAARPALHMQAGRPGLMRLMAGSEPLLWARVEDDYYGYWYVRGGRAAGPQGLVTPPITAVEARSPSAQMGSEAWYLAWAKFFARQLEASAASPLGPGRWWLVPSKAHAGPADWRHAASGGPTVPPVCRVDSVVEQGAEDYVDWDHQELAPLAMRPMSSGEDDRVKAWRRGCREKALPPILLMWISGLARYVILDGHDRLLAALAEGEMPPVLSLLGLQEGQRERDAGNARSVADEVSAQLLAAKDLDLRPRRPFRVETANSLLIEAYDDRPSLSPVTRAWPLNGGARIWLAEVRQALGERGASADDVREGMLTGLDADS